MHALVLIELELANKVIAKYQSRAWARDYHICMHKLTSVFKEVMKEILGIVESSFWDVSTTSLFSFL